MTDRRFFRASGPFSLSYIASKIDAETPSPVIGDISIQDVGDLETAGQGDFSVFFEFAMPRPWPKQKPAPW